MRLTQSEQIRKATKAYILGINNPSDGIATHRFSVYLSPLSGSMDILWPQDTENKSELISGQIHSKRKHYPAFHFALNGCGYSKEYEIATTLKNINPSLKVYSISGHSPRLIA